MGLLLSSPAIKSGDVELELEDGCLNTILPKGGKKKQQKTSMVLKYFVTALGYINCLI